MSPWIRRHFAWCISAPMVLLFSLAGSIGGPGYLPDVAAIHSLAANRAGIVSPAIWVTQIGGAPILLTILLGAIAWLALKRGWRPALELGAIVISGRIAVELLKMLIDRPRPEFLPYPVKIASLSFPSGHAANTMITFLALALLAAPERWRIPAIGAALAASGIIGATRPLLGVHWPTDVVGGWAFGIFWVIVGVALTRRSGNTAK